MMKSLRFFIMALLCAVANVAWGETKTITLSNANIVDAGEGTTGYTSWDITDNNNKTWNAFAIKNKHSNTTSDKHYLQIKKYASPTAYYIQVPVYGTKITSIQMTVSSSSQPMTGGGNSATLFFSNNNSTSATGTGVASGTGASSVTIDCSSLNLNTGYITASGAVRIWDVTVTYEEGSSNQVSTPTFSPAAGTYTTAQNVIISCATTGATIHYTTDGNDPTTSSPTYSDAIPVSTTTTIKAIAVKSGMTNSSVAEATYTITKTTAYQLVTDASQLFNDDVILIVNKESTKAMGGQNKNNRSATEVEIDNNIINLNDANEDVQSVQRITLQRSDNNFYFKVGNGYLYAASSDNNYLRTEANANDNAKATISINNDDGKASVIFQGDNTRNVMQYNSSSTLFACYESASQKPIYIYKQEKDPKQFELTIDSRSTDGKKNYYATISNLGSGNYVVPAGVKLSTITINNKKVVKTQTWEENDVISGNGAYYVVAAGIDDTNALTFNFAPTTNAVTKAPGTNWLHPAIANVPTAAPGEGSYLFYKLTLDANNTQNSVGFYWGGNDGVAFSFKTTHKAYLAIPQDSNSAGLSSIEIDDTTGINVIQSNTEQNDEVYTLSGVRVKGNLPKGIYIVNGKKQIVK